MKPEDLRAFFKSHKVTIEEKEIPKGIHFRGPDGEIWCVYESGKFVPQGNQNTKLALTVKEFDAGGSIKTEAPVFIVYGHDTGARDNLELLLRRMGLDPIVLAALPAAGDTIIEKLERYIGEHGRAGFACVLLTPDDEGHAAGKSEEKKYRARQNVVLELGMVLSRLGRSRVAILYKQSVELPSDISGLIYIPFQERVDEVRATLFKELQAAGYNPLADGL